MEIKLKDYGVCKVVRNEYHNGNVKLSLIGADDIPVANISTNIIPLFGNQFALDTNNLRGIVDEILASGLFTSTGDVVESGFCEYPIYELKG
jgi:hypothetical protein